MSSMTYLDDAYIWLTHPFVDPRKRPEPYPATMVCRPFLLAHNNGPVMGYHFAPIPSRTT